VIPRRAYELPREPADLQKRAIRLEWTSIAALVAIAIVMYLAMGSSQAMKTAWAEDVLSLVPPIAYLFAARVRKKPPTPEFPYGYHRSISIAFLCAAIALSAMGLFLLAEALHKLIRQEHPTIGTMSLFGWHVWQGWIMIAALAVTGIVPVVLGLRKLPLGRELHDKALHADADMNKADWLTAVAGIIGVFGIALGFWWADGAAAAAISLAITRDGFKNLKRVVKDLMDRAPTDVETDKPHELHGKLVAALESLSWVERAEVRLVVPGNDERLAGEDVTLFPAISPSG
jgi:cation diffusion facilitator family transporter